MRYLMAVMVLTACGGPVEPDMVTTEPGKFALVLEVDNPNAPIKSDVRVTATVAGPNGALAGIPNVLVNFVVTKGDGKVFSGTALTNINGQAKEVWTLGPWAGEQKLEVRAVDQATGNPITYAALTAQAQPGPLNTWHLEPSSVTVAPELSFDYTTLKLRGEDAYGNHIQVPQDFYMTHIAFEGGTMNEPAPTCSVEGTIIDCPPSSTYEPGRESWRNGAFRAYFRNGSGEVGTVQFVFQ